MEHFYKDIHGWFDFDDIYTEAVERAANGATLVEVGVGLGKSLAFLAVEAINSEKGLKLYGIDLFGGFGEDTQYWPGVGDQLQQVQENLAPVADQIELRVAPSAEAAKKFKNGTCSFVFIDAAHDYESVKADLAAWWPKVKKGGVFAGHDYGDPNWPDVQKAVDEFAADNGLSLKRSRSSWIVEKT